MQAYGFCQTTYPAKMISQQGDTIVAITVPQLKVINRTINGYEHLKEINSFLYKEVQYSEMLINELESVVLRKDSVIEVTEQKYKLSKEYSDHLQSAIDVNRKRNRQNVFKVGVIGVSIGAIIGILVK